MSKLSKNQKLVKRWKEYYDYVDEKDKKIYGLRLDSQGRFDRLYVNGFPAPQEFTQKYDGAKRRIRRNKKR